MPTLRLDLSGQFGGELQMRDGVDAHVDVVALAELGSDLL
jgi:hypothetical protein